MYGSVEGGTRHADVLRRTQTLRLVLIGLAVTAACCLVLIHTATPRYSLAVEVNGMELNAYLSASDAEEYNNLVAEQKLMDAKLPALLAAEQQMKPEDTKVPFVYRCILRCLRLHL